MLCYGYVLCIQKINTERIKANKQKSSISAGAPGRFRSAHAALRSLRDPLGFLPRLPGTQQSCQASLMERACFSDGETEALSKADVLEVTWPKLRYLLRYLLGPEELRG